MCQHGENAWNQRRKSDGLDSHMEATLWMQAHTISQRMAAGTRHPVGWGLLRCSTHQMDLGRQRFMRAASRAQPLTWNFEYRAWSTTSLGPWCSHSGVCFWLPGGSASAPGNNDSGHFLGTGCNLGGQGMAFEGLDNILYSFPVGKEQHSGLSCSKGVSRGDSAEKLGATSIVYLCVNVFRR